MAELLQTERVYVRDLQECIEVNMANMISQVHQEKHSWCFTAASNTEHKSVVKTLRCIFSDTNLTSYTTQNSSELKSLIFSADFDVREREFYQPVFCCWSLSDSEIRGVNRCRLKLCVSCGRHTCGRWRAALKTFLLVSPTRMTLFLETSRTSTNSTTGSVCFTG